MKSGHIAQYFAITGGAKVLKDLEVFYSKITQQTSANNATIAERLTEQQHTLPREASDNRRLSNPTSMSADGSGRPSEDRTEDRSRCSA